MDMPWEVKKPRKEAEKKLMRLFEKRESWTWGELLKEHIRSPAILAEILRDMEKKGLIVSSRKPEDRRIAIYKAVTDKIQPKKELYEAIDFLESMKNPVYRPFALIPKDETHRTECKIFIDEPKKKVVVDGKFFELLQNMAETTDWLFELKAKKLAILFTAEKIKDTEPQIDQTEIETMEDDLENEDFERSE
jgi:DNA-binding MarR family transcriptional regulator